MRSRTSVTDVARNFAEYINRVAYRGEHFMLMRGGRPVAELRPVPAGRKVRELPELLAGLPHLTEEEAASFSEDLTQAREELSRAPIRDPWES